MAISNASVLRNANQNPKLDSKNLKPRINNQRNLSDPPPPAKDITSEALGTIFNSYYTYNFFKNISSKEILKYAHVVPKKINPQILQKAEKNINTSLNLFGLTTALSFIPNIMGLCIDALNQKQLKKNQAQNVENNTQKLDIINKIIDAQKKNASKKTIDTLKQKYSHLEDNAQKSLDKYENNIKLSSNIKIALNSIHSISGLISVNYIYKAMKSPEILSPILSTFNHTMTKSSNREILKHTQMGMGLYAASLGINAISGLWNLSDQFFTSYNPSRQKNHSNDKLNNFKNVILPSCGQVISGISTAILLKNKDSWNTANVFTQGGSAIELNAFFKAFVWAGALSGIAGGATTLINSIIKKKEPELTPQDDANNTLTK